MTSPHRALRPRRTSAVSLRGLTKVLRRPHRRRRPRPRHRQRRVLLAARPLGLRQDHHAADDRRLQRPDAPARSRSAARTSPTCRRTSATSTPSSRATRCSSTSTSAATSASGCAARASTGRRSTSASARCSSWSSSTGRDKDKPRASLRRPAATRRARPGADQPAEGAAARRAAGRARPQAAHGDAGRAEVDPARGRHHLPVRHPRPGRGAEHERPGRDHERRRDRAVRHARGHLRAPRLGLRRPGSSAPAT